MNISENNRTEVLLQIQYQAHAYIQIRVVCEFVKRNSFSANGIMNVAPCYPLYAATSYFSENVFRATANATTMDGGTTNVGSRSPYIGPFLQFMYTHTTGISQRITLS